MAIYFTSDLHLGHENIIRFQNRPFTNANEMNKVLITNYNAVIRPDDTVYILGDLCFRMPSLEAANEIISSMNGKKILIRGNHDKQYNERLFTQIKDFETLKIHEPGNAFFAMMHYPMLSWPHSHHGSIQLHGHVHGTREDNENNLLEGVRRYDVGVDANDYYPVSLNKILEFFSML